MGNLSNNADNALNRTELLSGNMLEVIRIWESRPSVEDKYLYTNQIAIDFLINDGDRITFCMDFYVYFADREIQFSKPTQIVFQDQVPLEQIYDGEFLEVLQQILEIKLLEQHLSTIKLAYIRSNPGELSKDSDGNLEINLYEFKIERRQLKPQNNYFFKILYDGEPYFHSIYNPSVQDFSSFRILDHTLGIPERFDNTLYFTMLEQVIKLHRELAASCIKNYKNS